MSNPVKWIKITTDIFDDEKILMIEAMPSADSIIVIWFKLLTFAGKQNNDGVFLMSERIAYTDEMLDNLEKIMAHTLDTAGTRYSNFINSIQSCYDIVTKNRRELSPQVAPSVNYSKSVDEADSSTESEEKPGEEKE